MDMRVRRGECHFQIQHALRIVVCMAHPYDSDYAYVVNNTSVMLAAIEYCSVFRTSYLLLKGHGTMIGILSRKRYITWSKVRCLPVCRYQRLLLDVLILDALFAVCVLGCSSDSPPIADEQEANMLTIEDARSALIEMVRSGDNKLLKMSIPTLESEPSILEEEGWTAIGPWRIHLENRRFVIAIDTTFHFEEYGGTFRYRNGSWHAEVDHAVLV